MKRIALYEQVSGQKVNKSKSCFMLGDKASINTRGRVSSITGIGYQTLPIKYLGCPLYVGRKSSYLFQDIVDNIVSKINSWSTKWLSHGGRIVLLKNILYSMPIHLLTVIQPPKYVIHTIEKLFSDFLWENSEFGNKYHWRKWEDLCYPVEEGELGFQSLNTLIYAFGGKLW